MLRNAHTIRLKLPGSSEIRHLRDRRRPIRSARLTFLDPYWQICSQWRSVVAAQRRG
jgi:hypothetical protein